MNVKRKNRAIVAIVVGLAAVAFALSPSVAAACDGVQLSVPIGGQDCVPEGEVIFTYMRWIIRFFAAGVGLVVTLMVVLSGVKYIMSAGNPEGVQKAKSRLTNAIMALLLFIFATALMNFVIPGGIL